MNGIESLMNAQSGLLGNLESLTDKSDSGDNTMFADVLGDIYKLAENTDTADKESTLSLLAGDVDDISSVMIDSEKAEIALSLTIEIRNKILEAYNEIMNMQV